MSLTSIASPLSLLLNGIDHTAPNWKHSTKPTGPFSDKPTKPRPGDKLGRDVRHRGGLWSEAALEDAALSVRGPLQASLAGAIPASHTTTMARFHSY